MTVRPPAGPACAVALPLRAAGEGEAFTKPPLSAGDCPAISGISGPGSGGGRPGPRVRLADCWRSSKVNRLLGAKDDIDDFTESLESLAIMLLQFHFSLVQCHSVQFSLSSVVHFSFSSVQFCLCLQAAIVPPLTGHPGYLAAPWHFHLSPF